MKRATDEQHESSGPVGSAVPFTARLNAYYRAVESTCENPLLVDPFAERLAGDLTDYFEKHPRFTDMGGSQIARSFYIEHDLLTPWCDAHDTSQVVLLGAGLDTRAYRFAPLGRHSHAVFELDLPIIIKYKERILQHEKPLCNLVRLSGDLSEPYWVKELQKRGFSKYVPTFWILEGVAYYLEQRHVHGLLKALAEICPEESQLFADVCVPALADLKWGPFTDYFKWGILRDDVSSFFTSSGWKVTSSFLDDHAHGKDVGQRGLILVHGHRDISDVSDLHVSVDELRTSASVDIRVFSRDLVLKIIPRIQELVEVYDKDSPRLLDAYVKFIQEHKENLTVIARNQDNPVLLGMISPRLLGDPLSILDDPHKRTDEEIQSFIISNLQAIIQLAYCGVKGIKATEYKGTEMEKESRNLSEASQMASLSSLLAILKREVGI